LFTGKSIGVLAVQPRTKDMLYMAELCEAGKLNTYIDKRFPLSEVPEALRYVGEDRSRGKVVITMDEIIEV
jgi:NADPH:quinone reductase-like Zn-dependent oxidoreductase